MLRAVTEQTSVDTDDGYSAEHDIVEFDGFEMRFTFGRVLLAALVLASFAVWVYAYSGRADRVAPDTLDDPSFGAAAEAICSAAMTDIDQLPNALDATDRADRANQIRNINQRYTSMLDELTDEVAASPTRTNRDLGIINLWLDRWRIIVSDREDYANRLEDDPSAVFYLSAEAGRRAERSLSYVADTNGMPSCGAPGDLG